jgi:adenylate kinase
MGAAGSVPEHLDADQAKELAGEHWDEAKFNELATDGRITREQFEGLAVKYRGPYANSNKPDVPTEEPAAEKPKPTNPRKLIICGAPASGKGTQCERIREEFSCTHISTGDLLREHKKNGTELGRQAQEFMDNGQLVPDQLVIDMVVERLNQQDCLDYGWLLDGFPRTAPQAEKLTEAGFVPDTVVELEVNEESLVERVVGRRMDPETGKIYHLTFNPPENDEIAARLTQRSDDTEEKIRTRIAAFNENMEAVRAAYTESVVAVDGNAAPDVVWEGVRKAIADRAPESAEAAEAVEGEGGAGEGPKEDGEASAPDAEAAAGEVN